MSAVKTFEGCYDPPLHKRKTNTERTAIKQTEEEEDCFDVITTSVCYSTFCIWKRTVRKLSDMAGSRLPHTALSLKQVTTCIVTAGGHRFSSESWAS